MPEPVYFTVTADYKAFVEDYDTDSDYNPQQVPVSATVTFTPLVNSGDVLRALSASPRPVGYIPAPIVAIIDPTDGRLKLRDVPDADGTGGFAPVRLLGTSSILELNGPLFYAVSFSGVTFAGGRAGSITGFTFEAPSTDTEVNLIEVGRAAGQAAINIVRPTLSVGNVSTGNAGSSAQVTNTGTSTSAVFDFTIPRGAAGTVAVGTVSTGNPGSSVVVTNSGTTEDAVLNFTIPRGDPGATNTAPDTHAATSKATPVDNDELPLVDSAASWGLKKLTWANLKAAVKSYYDSVTATLTNKDLTSATNTFPSTIATTTNTISMSNKTLTSPTITSPTITGTVNAEMLGRLVCTTASGSNGEENGANTWAKIATLSLPTNTYQDINLILGMTARFTIANSSAIVSLFCRTENTGQNPSTNVRIIAASGSGFSDIAADSFKIISNGWGTSAELWMKKVSPYMQFAFYELSRFGNGGVTVTYNNNASWQSAIPTGTATNESSNGVSAFGIPVLTTIGAATVTNKDLSHATNTFPSTIATTTNTISMSNKTLTSPTITSPTINTPKIDTINDTNGNAALLFPATGSAVNYLQFANAATNTAPTITAVGSDSSVSINLIPKGAAGSVNLRGPSGPAVQVYAPASSVNYLQLAGSATGSGTSISALGSDTNVGINLIPKGSGTVKANGVDVVTTTGTQSLANKTLSSPTLTGPKMDRIYDTNGANLFTFGATANAVNYLQVVNAATGATPYIAVGGSDSNIGMQLISSGTGNIALRSSGNGNALIVQPVLSAANYLQVTAATASSDPSLSALGTDSNVSLNLIPKGSGTVKANGVPVVTRLASVPATATSTGTTGQTAWDDNYVYVCTATNTWKRAALSTW